MATTHGYSDVQLLLDGQWTAAKEGRTIDVINPATHEILGKVAFASEADLDIALTAAARGFNTWRAVVGTRSKHGVTMLGCRNQDAVFTGRPVTQAVFWGSTSLPPRRSFDL